MEEIMRYMIDPSADAVWDAIVTEVTADGVSPPNRKRTKTG